MSTLTKAKVICDSINPLGNRLITLELVYPRIIHSEVMSYSSFARNANSSRAMTPGSVVQQVRDEGFVPEVWRKADVRGMVPKGSLSYEDALSAEQIWREALADAVKHAKRLADLSVARELTNRILEPFAWMRTLVTASWPNLANMLHQRTAREAQHEIRELANRVGIAISESTPAEIGKSDWHIPYADGMADRDIKERLLISVARCARISYRTPRSIDWSEKQREDADIQLAMRLQRDAHWSPFEHQALCWIPAEYRNDHDEAVPHKLRGKFSDGWVQYRKTISGECFTDYNLGRFKGGKQAQEQTAESENNRSTVSWHTFSRELTKMLEKSLGIAPKS